MATAGMVRRLALIGYGVLAGVAGGLWLLAILLPGLTLYLSRTDFVGLYVGARLVAGGLGGHLYDLDVQRSLRESIPGLESTPSYAIFIFPAWTALVLAPLGTLPFLWAFGLWTATSVAAAVASVWRLVQATAERAAWPLLLVAVGGFLPLAYSLWQAQATALVLLSLTGAWLELRAGRDTRAGAWLILGLMKPQLLVGIALALLIRRQWRAVTVLAAGGLAVLTISSAVLGDWTAQYLALLPTYSVPETNLGDYTHLMQNWRGGIQLLLGTTSSPLANGLVLGLTALSLGLLVVTCWPRPQGPVAEVPLALATILGLLVNPHLLLYDVTIALVPGLALWRLSGGRSPRLRGLRSVLAVGPFAALLAVWWPLNVAEIGAWYLVLVVGAICWAWPDFPAARPVRQPADSYAERAPQYEAG